MKLGFDGSSSDWLKSLIGTTGKSAYEIALDNDFKGSEIDWLKSLKGEKGFSMFSNFIIDLETGKLLLQGDTSDVNLRITTNGRLEVYI